MSFCWHCRYFELFLPDAGAFTRFMQPPLPPREIESCSCDHCSSCPEQQICRISGFASSGGSPLLSRLAYVADCVAFELFKQHQPDVALRPRAVAGFCVGEAMKTSSVTAIVCSLHLGLNGLLKGPYCLMRPPRGQVAALVAAGVMSYDQGLIIVKVRGEAMQQWADEEHMSAIAVYGMEEEQLQKLCSPADPNMRMPSQQKVRVKHRTDKSEARPC